MSKKINQETEKTPPGIGVIKTGSFHLRAAFANMERERLKEKFKEVDKEKKDEPDNKELVNFWRGCID